jgi:Tol biopolymer transport system component/DNA-binding winged helix-turn-helix (wHTH) protein
VNGNFRVGEFLIEPQINTISGAERTARVEPKVMRVLVCLAEHASEVVPKEKLIRSVWADTFVTDDVLTRSISELRKVFGDDAKEPRFIQTIPRSGYRLVADVSFDSEKASAEPQVPADFSKPVQPRSWWRRAGSLTAMAVVLTLVVGGTVWYSIAHRSVESSLPPMKVVPFTSFPGWEGNPAFSPDGNQIAFDWGGEKCDNGDIYVMLIGSAKPLQLTFDPASDCYPTWSPDGRQLAFVRVSESEIAVYTVPALGGPARKLLSLGPKADWGYGIDWGLGIPHLDWSADGKYIACEEKRSKQEAVNIFLFSPETGEKRTLTSPGAQNLGDFYPAFSPDSKTLSFARSPLSLSSDIFVVSVTGGEPRRLTSDNAQVLKPAWTADGREIIFSSTRAGGDFGLWRISASGGTPERLAVGGHYAHVACISRQGNRLAYVQSSPGCNIYRIGISDSASANLPIKLTTATRIDCAPQYSPDGKKIVFQSDRSGSNEIWMCDSDGSHLVQVTSLNGFSGTPRWSPNGQQIAFDSYPGGKGSIYVINAEGGTPRPIVTDESDNFVPSWSRDGRSIYFASNRTGESQVWKVPAEGGGAVQVTRQGGGLAFESLDGKYVYYRKEYTPGIWRVPVGGGEETQVFDSFNSELFGDWAVVNDGIYFINPDAREGVAIEFFNFATRQIKQVAGLGKISIYEHCIAVSPDRRQILYTQGLVAGDIMLVENFR